MAIDAGLAAFAGVVVGQGIGFATEALRRKWSRTDIRKQGVSDRAVEAARAILDVLDEVRRLLDGRAVYQTDEIRPDQRYELCHKIDREAILLPNPALRERLEGISTGLWYVEYVAKEHSHHLHRVGVALDKGGYELLGAFLRDEPLPAEDSTEFQKTIRGYYDSATEYDELVKRVIEREAPPEDLIPEP